MQTIEIPEHWKPCEGCGGRQGVVEEKNGQDTVRCNKCARHLGNISRRDSGRAPRTVATTPDVSASVRAFVMERAGARCESCGWPAAIKPLEIGHFLSKKDAHEQGFTDAEIQFGLAAVGY